MSEYIKQREWQARMQQAGRCTNCGALRDGKSKTVCDECLLKRRIAARRYYGCKPRVAGGRGRPPLPTYKERL